MTPARRGGPDRRDGVRPALLDYHVHTKRCKHAVGEIEEYARAAMQAGVTEVGFSDHLPLVPPQSSNYHMDFSELDDYVRDVRRIRHEFPKLTIRLAVEADYLPGREALSREILARHAWDYVIGSVHYLDGWGFDNEDEIARWSQVKVDEVYRRYYATLRQSAETGLFDVIGHCDLVKKFGHRPSGDLGEDLRSTARCFAAEGVAVEVNTSGLRKPVHEIYPSARLLGILRIAGVPVTLGSDAHAPQEVGKNFPEALALMREAGYETYRRYVGRIPEELPLPEAIPADGR